MSFKSLKTPLRYPGGKSKAIKTLSQWYPKIISEYGVPFIGGGPIAIDITKSNPDIPVIAAQFFSRLTQILEDEKIDADKKVVAELINKHFPDWRRVLNECQRYSVSGKIDSGILVTFSDVSVDELTKNLKQKNFSAVRKWTVDNLDNDPAVLLRRIYDALYGTLNNSSIPAAVLIIAKYQYQIAFVADQEINLLACLTEIMVECEFK